MTVKVFHLKSTSRHWIISTALAQVVEAEELEGQLYAELEGLPKYGKQFASAIRCILKRENRCACLLLADQM
jgi:hypothetical protein